MKAPLSSSMLASGAASSWLTNWGRKARKKIDSFGLRMLIRIAVTVTCDRRARIDLALDLNVPCSRSAPQAMYRR